jgi:DNA-binding NarL/FixJ family response regulator
VRLILEGEPDLTVVAEAGDGAEAVDLARARDVDLAVLDIAMPRMTGLQAARELSRRLPGLHILVLTMYDNEQYFFEALKAGASGYVLKSVADRDLVEACRAAVRDESFIYPGAERALVRSYLERLHRGDGLPERAITALRAQHRPLDRVSRTPCVARTKRVHRADREPRQHMRLEALPYRTGLVSTRLVLIVEDLSGR